MDDLEYSKFITVLLQYGLWPIEWAGDLIVLRNPQNDTVMAIASSTATPIPRDALEDILAAAGMDMGQFLQLYETV